MDRSDGERCTLVVSSAPVRNETGAISCVVATAVDITDRKRAENEARESAKFEQRVRGIVSHDLRSPLNTITLGAGMILAHGGDLDASVRYAALKIRSSAERAGRLISDLLDYTRVHMGGGIRLVRKDLDLNELAQQVVEEIRVAHPDREILLDHGADSRGQFDPDRIAQAISNLVTNALQYSPPASPVKVEISCSREFARVVVQNRGSPIAKDVLPHIFEPMQRGSTEEAHRSLGLGLFIVRQIARAHGGHVRVTSDAAQGTTFCLELPRYEPRPEVL